MFPDEQISQVHELKISEDDLRACFGEDDGWSEEIAVFPTLVGCANYALVLEQEKRQTGFIMNVIRRSDANGVIAIGPAFGDVPVEQLELQRHVLGDIIAD
jgi:hypothetical protein